MQTNAEVENKRTFIGILLYRSLNEALRVPTTWNSSWNLGHLERPLLVDYYHDRNPTDKIFVYEFGSDLQIIENSLAQRFKLG